MITRYCKTCDARTPWNKAENLVDSPYICEGCGSVENKNGNTKRNNK